MKYVQWILNDLGLGDANITMGSLRTGGTTYYFIHGVGIARLKYLGRWVSESSLSV